MRIFKRLKKSKPIRYYPFITLCNENGTSIIRYISALGLGLESSPIPAEGITYSITEMKEWLRQGLDLKLAKIFENYQKERGIFTDFWIDDYGVEVVYDDGRSKRVSREAYDFFSI